MRYEELNQDTDPRWESPDILVPGALDPAASVWESKSGDAELWLESNIVEVHITRSLFMIKLFREGKPYMSINDRLLSYYEQRAASEKSDEEDESKREKAAEEEKKPERAEDWGEDGKAIYADGGDDDEGVDDSSKESTSDESSTDALADRHAPEMFGGSTDSKPNGAMSVGVDVTFPNAKHVYGIPEHATQMSLKSTDGSGARTLELVPDV